LVLSPHPNQALISFDLSTRRKMSAPARSHEQQALQRLVADRDALTTVDLVLESRNWHGLSLRFDSVFTHALCADGRFAAWVAHQYNPNARVYPLKEQQSHFDEKAVKGQHVLILDQCFDVNALLAIVQEAAHVSVVEHHESSRSTIKAALARNASRAAEEAVVRAVGE
jgi:hypothetical protein